MQSQIDQFTNAIRHSGLVFGSLYDEQMTMHSNTVAASVYQRLRRLADLSTSRSNPRMRKNTSDTGVAARVTLHNPNVVKTKVYED
jgi:hypothetical protein